MLLMIDVAANWLFTMMLLMMEMLLADAMILF